MRQLIIIAGSQRSGTTLLGQVLGSDPNAVLIDENDGLYRWTVALFRHGRGDREENLFQSCLERAGEKYRNPETRFKPDGKLRNIITHIVLKAPNLTYEYENVARFMPGAKAVFIVRDIRDVVASMAGLAEIPMLENQLRFVREAPQVRENYSGEVRIILTPSASTQARMALIAMVKMKHRDRFLESGIPAAKVRYEDLVRDPERTTREILKFCGLDHSDRTAPYQEVLTGTGPGGTRRDRAIDEKSIGKWTKTLAAGDEDRIWAVAGDFLEKNGYKR